MTDRPYWAVFAVLFLCSFQFADGVTARFFMRGLVEPYVTDFRIRIASQINNAGLGLGGIMTILGHKVHHALTDFGDQIELAALRLANQLENKKEHDKVQQQNKSYKIWLATSGNKTASLPTQNNNKPILQEIADIFQDSGESREQIDDLSAPSHKKDKEFDWLGLTKTKEPPIKKFFDAITGKKKTTKSPLGALFGKKGGSSKKSPFGALFG